MTNNIDELLKTALAPGCAPDKRLNNQVLIKAKERKNMTGKRKIPVAAIIAACILILGSFTVLAAYHYESIEVNETDIAVENFMQNLTSDNIDEFASPVESTRMICTPDADGMLYYEYKLEDGVMQSRKISMEVLFPYGFTDRFVISGYSYVCSENGQIYLNIDTYMLNKDGTVTFVLYETVL